MSDNTGRWLKGGLAYDAETKHDPASGQFTSGGGGSSTPSAEKPPKHRRSVVLNAMQAQEWLEHRSDKRDKPMQSPSQKKALEKEIFSAAQKRNKTMAGLRPHEKALFEHWRGNKDDREKIVSEHLPDKG